MRRQELAGVVEHELHGLKCERDRNRALERHARFRVLARIHFQIPADGLLNDWHVHRHGGAAFALGAHDDLLRLQHRGHDVDLVVEKLLQRPGGNVRADAAGLDEFLERENIDGILHHRPCTRT